MLSTIMPLTQMCSAVAIISLVFTIHLAYPAFIVTPSSQVVLIGQEAVFRCRDPTASAIGWTWNGSDVIVASPPLGITLGNDSLTIVAQSNYNETEIVCVAFSSSAPTETTLLVKLLIQGPLSTVNNIERSSIITWKAPFSLDLTGVDPDIVYCVEVYNITCGVDDLVVGDCNVTEPRFVDNSLQQGYIYHITITPRSNGQDAQNGTSNTKEEMFTTLTDPKTNIMFRSTSTMVTAVIHFRDDGTGIEPASYFLNLTSIDGTKELPNTPFATSSTQDTNANSTILTVSQSLPYRRLWNCQILALGCSEHPITSVFEISSHDFQNITVSSSSPGEIGVTGDFIPGSLAIGIFIVVYSADNHITNYYFIHRYSMHMSSLTDLPSGQYKVSIFVMEGNGLPFNRSATTPRNVSLTKSGDIQSLFEYQVHPTSTSICVTCTFLDSSATGCVVVVHQRISQLSSSGLMNIKSSHKFNRFGDTAYGCIDGVNLIDRQIGVFSLEEVVPTLSTSHVSFIVTIVVVVLVTIPLLLLATILIIVYCKKRILRLFQSIREYVHIQKKSCVSTTLQRLTTDSSTSQTDDKEIYDKLQGPVKKSQIAAEKVHMHMLGTEEAAVVEYLGIIYTSVKLGPPSGVMGHDDLHKTTAQYSELQQEPQEEESFNEERDQSKNGSSVETGGLQLAEEGAASGNADNRCCSSGDTDLTLGISDESIQSSFYSLQGPKVPAELTGLNFMEDQNCIVGDGATTVATQCTDTENSNYSSEFEGLFTSSQVNKIKWSL